MKKNNLLTRLVGTATMIDYHVREKHPEKCTNQSAGTIVGILGIQNGTQPRMRGGVPCCFAVTNNICMHMKMHKDIFEDKQKNIIYIKMADDVQEQGKTNCIIDKDKLQIVGMTKYSSDVPIQNNFDL